jgi:glycosyltransferase involved in cell wall biosynthesis
VTEHAVAEQAEAWEQHSDVLLALTRQGVERLKARWRHKRIEFVPPGCPCWRPAPRGRAERKLAVIGRPTPERGAQQLLEALHALPGTELLIFAVSSTAGKGQNWLEAADRLPVDWCELPASDEELARQLGQAADMVVFWHDELPYASTSYAARIALASGLPVLTSSTGEFSDLADVVFQPKDLVAGVEELLANAALRADLVSAARDYCEAANWQRVAAQHLNLWQTLLLS